MFVWSIAVVMVNTVSQLGFLKPLDLYKMENPYWLFIGKPKNAPDVDITNVETERVSVPVCDVRNHEIDYSLEKQGFQFIIHKHTFQSFDDEQRLRQEYLPQVEKTIRDIIPEAERVHIYDWRVCITCSADERSLTSPRSERRSPRRIQNSYP